MPITAKASVSKEQAAEIYQRMSVNQTSLVHTLRNEITVGFKDQKATEESI